MDWGIVALTTWMCLVALLASYGIYQGVIRGRG